MVNLDYLNEIEQDYPMHPTICFYCGTPIPFKKFLKQLNYEKKFCCKKCKTKYNDELKITKTELSNFSSKTEELIYLYLMYKYPNHQIAHNLKDVFPPYEIDFSIQINDTKIYIEYNGSLHCTKKKKSSNERIVDNCKINDVIKLEEICNKRKNKMIRIWSEIGLYSNSEIFNKILNELKTKINILAHLVTESGICYELIVDKNYQLHEMKKVF